jgi:hypothetical protein
MADRQESHDGWQSLGSERDQNKDGKSDGLDRSAFVHRRHTDDKEHNGKDDGRFGRCIPSVRSTKEGQTMLECVHFARRLLWPTSPPVKRSDLA